MPTQYPTLSQGEQTARWNDMAKQNLYPYTYLFTGSFLNASFPRNNGSVNFLTIPFQADNNLALSNLEISFSGVPQLVSASSADTTGNVLIQVSYDSNLNSGSVTPSTSPVVPSDSGNIIYDSNTSFKSAAHTGVIAGTLYADPVTINVFNRYEPYNYLLKFNQILYIHVGMQFNGGSLETGGTWFAGVVFHCLDTGLKT